MAFVKAELTQYLILLNDAGQERGYRFTGVLHDSIHGERWVQYDVVGDEYASLPPSDGTKARSKAIYDILTKVASTKHAEWMTDLRRRLPDVPCVAKTPDEVRAFAPITYAMVSGSSA